MKSFFNSLHVSGGAYHWRGEISSGSSSLCCHKKTSWTSVRMLLQTRNKIFCNKKKHALCFTDKQKAKNKNKKQKISRQTKSKITMKFSMKSTYFLANGVTGIFDSMTLRLLHNHSSVEQQCFLKLVHTCRNTPPSVFRKMIVS